MKTLQHTLVVAVFGMLAACSRPSPDHMRYAPAQASVAVLIDGGAMADKLAADSLSLRNLLGQPDSADAGTAFGDTWQSWTDWEQSGIDLREKLLISVWPDGNSGTVQMLAGVRDAARVDALVRKQWPAAEIREGNGFRYAGQGPVVAGWNKSVVMLVMQEGARSGEDFSQPAGRLVDSLKAWFDLPAKRQLARQLPFTQLSRGRSDIAILTKDIFTGNMAALGALAAMPGVQSLVIDNYTLSFINFEEGRIQLRNEVHTNDKVAALLKKYAGPEVDMDLVERFPAQRLDGAAGFSFSPELIPALLKEGGLETLTNLALAQEGMQLSDLAAAFGGKFAVVFGDIATRDRAADGKDAAVAGMPGKLVMAARIGDQAMFDKVVSAAERKGACRREGNRIVLKGDGEKLEIGVANGLLAISTDSLLLQQYLAGSHRLTLNDTIRQSLQNASTGFYMNLASLAGQGRVDELSTAGAGELFRHLWMRTAQIKGDRIEGEGALEMKPGSNSLSQLVRFRMKQRIHQPEGPEEIVFQFPRL